MTARKSNGQFKSGKSGNPKGRPSTNIGALRNQLSENIQQVINIVLNAALEGDLQACKMLLDRTLPSIKPQQAPVYIELPERDDLLPLADTIIRSAAKGELPSESALQLVTALAYLLRINSSKILSDDGNDNLISEIKITIIDSDKMGQEMKSVNLSETADDI